MTADGRAGRFLDGSLGWQGDNRGRLERMLADFGHGGARRGGGRAPVAVLDWDDTVIAGDLGDALFFDLLREDRIVCPPGNDWRRRCRLLSDEGAAALAEACRGVAPGERVPTSRDAARADELMSIYLHGVTRAGEPAFADFDPAWMQPSYALPVFLLAGWTPADVARFAREAIAEGTALPPRSARTVGSFEGLRASMTMRPRMRGLVGALLAAGFEVWVLSSTPQEAVEVFAAQVGIEAGRVIGLRGVLGDDGRLTGHLAGCGPVADTADIMIPYRDGKRVWMNGAIFGKRGEAALARDPDPAGRPVFCAGDSDSDYSFVREATGLRLVFERATGDEEIHLRARRNGDGAWLFEPVSI